MNKTNIIVLAVVALVAFSVAKLTTPKGISPQDVAEIARRSGDSAIVSYKTNISDVVGRQLNDSIRFYKGKAESAVRLVVNRPTVVVHDTIHPPKDSLRSDTLEFTMPPVDTIGFRVNEVLGISPPPTFVSRGLKLTFDPDTIVVALLKTPDGLERFTAQATRLGLKTNVVNAAGNLPSEHKNLKAVIQVTSMIGCIVTGIGLADKNGTIAASAAVPCVGGNLLRLAF